MTPDLPPIEYRPTFRLDSSGLVVGTATQEEWDAAVEEFQVPGLSGNTRLAACVALENVQ